jgi:putative membrane protein
MRGFLARLFITAFGLWIADLLLAGVHFDGWAALWIAALLLGLVNAIVRPVLIILTLPFTLITLGLFIFVVNGAMVLLVSRLMPSFHVEGLWTAILASVVVGLTGWLASGFVGNRGTVEVWKVSGRD